MRIASPNQEKMAFKSSHIPDDVSFDGPDQRKWPSSYKDAFSVIDGKKTTTFSSFKKVSIRPFVVSSRGQDLMKQAEKIAASAALCIEEEQSEAGWGFALDPLIFSQFTTQLAWSVTSFSLFLPPN
jgi:hypothetical protein